MLILGGISKTRRLRKKKFAFFLKHNHCQKNLFQTFSENQLFVPQMGFQFKSINGGRRPMYLKVIGGCGRLFLVVWTMRALQYYKLCRENMENEEDLIVTALYTDCWFIYKCYWCSDTQIIIPSSPHHQIVTPHHQIHGDI